MVLTGVDFWYGLCLASQAQAKHYLVIRVKYMITQKVQYGTGKRSLEMMRGTHLSGSNDIFE